MNRCCPTGVDVVYDEGGLSYIRRVGGKYILKLSQQLRYRPTIFLSHVFYAFGV